MTVAREPGEMNRMDRLGRFIFGFVWIYFAVYAVSAALYPPIFIWIPVALGFYAWATGWKAMCPVYRALGTFS